jgi:hypothetical protein
MQRLTISISEAQAARLRGETLRSGAPASLQVRRALDIAEDVRQHGVGFGELTQEQDRNEQITGGN